MPIDHATCTRALSACHEDGLVKRGWARRLQRAATNGDVTELRLLLSCNKRLPGAVDLLDLPDDFTPLHIAALHGNADCIRVLSEAGASLNLRRGDDAGFAPLHLAAHQGHVNCVQVLCEVGAGINQSGVSGITPLCVAVHQGQAECLRLLCEAGAAVNKVADAGVTPLWMAALQGHTVCAHILSSYGARDETAAAAARRGGHVKLADWLRCAQAWTPLHHLEVLTPARALSLLRGGADLHTGSPSPLERARTVPGEVSALVVHAGRRWSPQTHHLFPATARSYAVEVLRLGYLLAWSPRYTGEASSLVDVWLGYVLPHMMERGS